MHSDHAGQDASRDQNASFVESVPPPAKCFSGRFFGYALRCVDFSPFVAVLRHYVIPDITQHLIITL